MKPHLSPRLTAAALALALLAVPTAQALTVDQAAELIETLYVDQVPASVLEQPTIDDMLQALGDPYTQYFTAQEYDAFNASMSDTSLVGVGIVFNLTDDGLLLSRVLEGSPAETGGLQGGDLIIAVDGRSVLGADTETVTGWIQGKEGTKVSLTYLREGHEQTVRLTRALVVAAATTSRLVDGHIGYITCTAFGSETVGHFEEAIETYGDKADVWVVDLRSNLGGATRAATDAAGLFTGPGEMTYMRDNEDIYGVYYHSGDAATLWPVIVLVDQHSASSSEIFASAIRDRNAGIVVGTRTYGKGVAQTVVDQDSMPDYFPDGDALKVTSHRFYSPAGNTTDQVGVIPDLLVDADSIDDVAYLLAASPAGDTSGELRVDIRWRWRVDLADAASPEYCDAFAALLDALPDSTDLWLGTGGPDGWKRTTSSTLAKQYGLALTPGFPDAADSAYPEFLDLLQTYDLIQGKDDGLFHPSDTLTRAELCQLLAVALNCFVPDNTNPFSDVPADAWYAPAVTAMSNMSLVDGVGGGFFRPEDPVDHQQLITILARLAQRLNMSFARAAKELPDDLTQLPGMAQYSPWAQSGVWYLAYSQQGYFGNTLSLLWDEPGAIDPTASATRDEAAFLLCRLLTHTGILPA